MNRMTFFISTGLGMEEGLAQEMREQWTWLLDLDGRPHSELFPELLIEKGGVTFQAPLHLGLQFNFFLKTANRILLRLAEFRVRDFPKLYQKAKSISWHDWLAHKEVYLEVAASQSRLNNEKRVAETLSDAWGLKSCDKDKAKDKIFVRVFDDLLTVSLDTSGEHLHFRGQEKWIGEAPVRETLAAFCLQRLIGENSWSSLREVTLVDPMMGSGTFLLEALKMGQPVSRKFSFQSWKKCPKALNLPAFYQGRMVASPWAGLQGSDLEDKIVKSAQKNISAETFSSKISVEVRDLFSDKTSAIPHTWMILNPPYGERIAWDHTPDELLTALDKKWNPERIGILWTVAQAQKAPQVISSTRGTLRQSAFYPLQNGGIRVQFQVWNRE